MAFTPTQFNNDAELVPTAACCGGTGLATSGTSGNLLVSNGTTWVSSAPAATGGGDPAVLYKCSGWSTGVVCIPSSLRGKYNAYEIQGQVGYWTQYCSQLTFGFAGANDGACQPNGFGGGMNTDYCCMHNTCGWVGDIKCFDSSSSYTCAGAIAWPFGCGSGCDTACSIRGWQFFISLNPWGACDGKLAHYCVSTTNQGGGEYCCIGSRNVGELCSCCGGDARCLRCIFFTTPSATNAIACCSSITVIGKGRLV